MTPGQIATQIDSLEDCMARLTAVVGVVDGDKHKAVDGSLPRKLVNDRAFGGRVD